MNVRNNGGDIGSGDDKGLESCCSITTSHFSDKKQDHMICQGCLNLLLWQAKLAIT